VKVFSYKLNGHPSINLEILMSKTTAMSVLILVFGVSLFVSAQDEKSPPAEKAAVAEEQTDFGKNILVIWTNSTEKGSGNCMGEAKVKKIAGRSFLVGKTVDVSGGAVPDEVGTIAWVAVSDISQMYEYPNVESAIKAYTERERAYREHLEKSREQ
jgi:hypothetical protein